MPDITSEPPQTKRGIPPSERKAPDLATLKRWVTESQSLATDAREQSLLDIDYYDGHQLTATEKAALAARKQPDIVINRARSAINGILGVTEQGKSEPRAFPRTPGDDDSADVATDTLRYIAEHNRFSRIKQDVFLNMLVPGTGAVLVGVNEDNDVTIEQIRWEEFIVDQTSRRKDCADARWMGIAKWMYADDAAAMYPEARDSIQACVSQSGLIADITFQDRPDGGGGIQWTDSRQRRLMMIEIYYREGGWKRCVFHAGGICEEGDSPYTDAKGRPCNPIVAQSAYVDRNNNRYGAMRDMRGPQDEINKRRSKLLHMISVSQIQAVDPSAISVDADAARKEAAKPDGVIPFGWQKVPTSDAGNGQALLLQEAKGELERLGPNPAILGRQGADSSGRAVLARQQAGMTELAPLFGGLEDWELRTYCQMWARAKQYWTAPMFIRVTDDEDAPKFIGLNEPIPGPPQIVMGPEGIPTIQPTVSGYKNAVGEMDVDITLESVPEVANIQAEQFQDLLQLVSASPVYQQQVPFEVLFELSATTHKRQIRDQMKRYREEQAQASAQAQQQQQQMAQAGAEAQIRETNSKATLNEVTAQTKQADTTIKAFQAGLSSVQPPPGSTGASGSQAS